MRKLYLALSVLCLMPLVAMADGRTLDNIRRTLEASSSQQVQEKVYIHTDNTCYFLGDTLWYKAYVVRADDLYYTDMSRILYVELLTPDGLLVERQRLIVSGRGYSCGNFRLPDSLYSGYYELRAYTRWMLNFNAVEQRYSKDDANKFYNRRMAADYFRRWDGLYSRVLPVYNRPDAADGYTYKSMASRPKQHVQKAAKRELRAAFYPEGGHLVEGVPCRVAFELTDQDGAAVNVKGSVTAGGVQKATATVTHQGRGAFTVTPDAGRLTAKFRWHDKDYEFDLPKAERQGVAMTVADGTISLTARNMPTDREYAVSIICRGVLKYFQPITFGADGHASVAIPDTLTTGVNDVTLFDNEGRIVADRLFFVNNHDYDDPLMAVESGADRSYAPHERIDIGLRCEGVTEPALFSVSVRDSRTDEDSYDDGDIMTDLLLAGDLRGFVANPSYYFESADKAHTDALDLLMMVQGWRKYKWSELADTTCLVRRYRPETSLTVEGAVYKMLSIEPTDPQEIGKWLSGLGKSGLKSGDDEGSPDESQIITTLYAENDNSASGSASQESTGDAASIIEYDDIEGTNVMLGVNHGGLKKEVTVEAEVVMGDGVVGSAQRTHDGGRYIFEVPPFYGTAILNMKAYNEKDSLKKGMTTSTDKHFRDETAFPDYYVKRDLFYPIYTNPYSYYQTHAPEIRTSLDIVRDTLLSDMESEDHLLDNVDVKGKKRGKRAIDHSKPAYVADAYDLYNDMTDYGLSFGMLDMRQFPVQVARFLLGNMGRYNRFNVDGMVEGVMYYRNYAPDENKLYNGLLRSPYAIYSKLQLKRMEKIRVFTDYEPRNEDKPMVLDKLNADVTLDIMPFADDMEQPSFRDRHIVLKGFNEAAEFYNPDYSTRKPDGATDHRRTLYWNPNARTDNEGRFRATFYNNSQRTTIKISAAGIAPDGRIIRLR